MKVRGAMSNSAFMWSWKLLDRKRLPLKVKEKKDIQVKKKGKSGVSNRRYPSERKLKVNMLLIICKFSNTGTEFV